MERKEIINEVINHPKHYQLLDEEYRKDLEISLYAISNYPINYVFCLCKSEAMTKSILIKDPSMIQYVPEEFQNDEIHKNVLMSNPLLYHCLKNVSKEIKIWYIEKYPSNSSVIPVHDVDVIEASREGSHCKVNFYRDSSQSLFDNDYGDNRGLKNTPLIDFIVEEVICEFTNAGYQRTDNMRNLVFDQIPKHFKVLRDKGKDEFIKVVFGEYTKFLKDVDCDEDGNVFNIPSEEEISNSIDEDTVENVINNEKKSFTFLRPNDYSGDFNNENKAFYDGSLKKYLKIDFDKFKSKLISLTNIRIMEILRSNELFDLISYYDDEVFDVIESKIEKSMTFEAATLLSYRTIAENLATDYFNSFDFGEIKNTLSESIDRKFDENVNPDNMAEDLIRLYKDISRVDMKSFDNESFIGSLKDGDVDEVVSLMVNWSVNFIHIKKILN